MMIARRLALLLVALLVLAACAGTTDTSAGDEAAGSEPAAAERAEPSEPATASAPAAASEPAAAGTTIEVGESDLGSILVDGEGMTLYVFDNDTENTSACTGDCAANWPPLTGEVSAGEGVDEGLLGIAEREDGTAQTTYDGQPLYYFAGDQAAGDTNGQGVGGIWWVVGPDGQKITSGDQSASARLGY